MKRPLSIFSFKSWQGPLRIPAAFAWAVFILLGFRLFLFELSPVVENQWNQFPRKSVEQAGAYLLANRDRDIRYLFFGSSRMKSGVQSDLWASLSGQPEESAMNLAISSGTFQDAIEIVERGGGVPERAEVAVIGVDLVFFNKNRLYPPKDKPERVAKGIGNTIWPVAWRRPVIEWIRGIKGEAGRIAASISPPVYHTNTLQARRLAESPFFSVANMGSLNLYDFKVDPRTLYQLKTFTSLLQRKSVHVVLVHQPIRQGYYASLTDDRVRSAYDSLITDLRALAVPNMDFIYWETSADCGLDDSIFLDFGHFSKEGAARFTRRLHKAVMG